VGSWCLIIAVICVLFSLIFSTANFSLRQIFWVKLEDVFEGKSQLGRAKWMKEHLTELVYTTALFRLLANLGIIFSLVNYFLAHHPPEDALQSWPITSALIWSFLILVICSEVVAHAWARNAGNHFLVTGFGFLRLCYVIVWPWTKALQSFDLMIRRLAGFSNDQANGINKEERQEELLNIMEEGEKEGVVDEEEREMIASVLEFRDTTAGEIMTPRTDVVGIAIDLKFSDIADAVIANHHSRYPVYEESIDKIVGMIYAKDLLRHISQVHPSMQVRDLLRKPYFVPETKTLRDLLHDLQNQKLHLAVVLDEYGGTAGVVTIEDILEELVGEIVDEYEEPQAEMLKKIDDRTYEVDARCHVDELNELLDLNIPEDEDYETIGGFSFAQLGSIPLVGETFEYNQLLFTIVGAQDRKIDRLRFVIEPDPPEAK
jgi:putative hemolysin